GRVVLVTTSANEEWTDFPHDPSYPQLLFELLDGSLRSRDAWMNLTVGDRLAIPVSVRGASVPALTRLKNTITKVPEASIPVFPPEREVKISQTSGSGDTPDEAWRGLYHTEALDQPGVYTLALGNRQVPVVVNVPARSEADVSKVDAGAVGQALGG